MTTWCASYSILHLCDVLTKSACKTTIIRFIHYSVSTVSAGTVGLLPVLTRTSALYFVQLSDSIFTYWQLHRTVLQRRQVTDWLIWGRKIEDFLFHMVLVKNRARSKTFGQQCLKHRLLLLDHSVLHCTEQVT